MKNSLETRLGIFVALTVLAAILIIETLGGIEFFQRGYRVTALFNSAHDLKVGDRVKMAGVEIGRVEDISLSDSRVNVVMKLHENAVVKTDSKANITFAGLMGQNFVNISFGSPIGVRLKNGDAIETFEQPDLAAILAKLDNAASGIENVTKSFSGDKIDSLFGPFTHFFKQNSQPISDTIANVKNVTGKIASGDGTVGRLIYSNTLYSMALDTVSNLQSTAGDAKGVIADAKLVVEDARAGKGTIGLLLTDDTLYRTTTAAMTNAQQILQKINQGQGTFGKLVNDQEFYKNAKLSLQKLDKATDSIEDQGPISILGIMTRNLF